MENKVKYCEKHLNDLFLRINIYDDILDCHKCYIVKSNKDYKESACYVNSSWFDLNQFELKDYGFYYNHGDDGHIGELYYINLNTHKDVAHDIINDVMRIHQKEVDKLNLFLNLLIQE